MLTVDEHFKSKLNDLQTSLAEGVLAPTSWLEARGYSRSLLAGYVKRGWLESPAHGVYRRPGPPLKWQHVVYSLGQMLERPPHVGGLSALELRGYAHFLKPHGPGTIHLYRGGRLPGWVAKLKVREKFVEHRDYLFTTDASREGVVSEPWGPWDWDLLYSTPEQAILEFLDEVPKRQSVEHADALVAGLSDLSSRRVLKLLATCRSVKVKRLFLALASRYGHTWAKAVVEAADRGEVNWGRGKRSLVPGGKLHPKYLITLPEMTDVRG